MTASTLTEPTTDSIPAVELRPYTAAVVLTGRRYEVMLGDSDARVLEGSGNDTRGTSLDIMGDIILALGDLLPAGGTYAGIGFVLAEEVTGKFPPDNVSSRLGSKFGANVVVDVLPNTIVRNIDELIRNAGRTICADILHVFANDELSAAFMWADGSYRPILLGGPAEERLIPKEIDRAIEKARCKTGPFTSEDWNALVAPLVDAIERLQQSMPCDIIVFGGSQPIHRRRLQQAFSDVVAARELRAWVLSGTTDGRLGAAALQAAAHASSN